MPLVESDGQGQAKVKSLCEDEIYVVLRVQYLRLLYITSDDTTTHRVKRKR